MEKNKNGMKMKRSVASILSVKLDIGGFEDGRMLYSDLIITEDLEDNCMNQPHSFAWWGMAAAGARKVADEAKESLSVVEANISKKIRESGIKMTIDEVNKSVTLCDEYKEASNAKIKAFYEADMCKVAVEALHHRRDMLVTLANLRRQEMASGITMMEANNQLKGKVLKKIKRSDHESD